MWVHTGNLTKFQVVVALHEYLLRNYCQALCTDEASIAQFFIETEDRRLKQIEALLIHLQSQPRFDNRFNISNHSFGISNKNKKLQFCFIIDLALVGNDIPITIEQRGFDANFFDNICSRCYGLEDVTYFLGKNFPMRPLENHAQKAISIARMVIPPSIHAEMMANPRPIPSLSSQSTTSPSSISTHNSSRQTQKPTTAYNPFFCFWHCCTPPGNNRFGRAVGPDEVQNILPPISPIKARKLFY